MEKHWLFAGESPTKRDGTSIGSEEKRYQSTKSDNYVIAETQMDGDDSDVLFSDDDWNEKRLFFSQTEASAY